MAGSARRSLRRARPEGASKSDGVRPEAGRSICWGAPMTVATFPIEKVRAAFPALEREVNGQPVAYLDSGASAQRVLASIQAVDRYERAHHSNVHRGSHTLSAEATAAYEGARATVADHLGAGDRREVIVVRNPTEAINLVALPWAVPNAGERHRHP